MRNDTLLAKGFVAQAKSLREFGYRDVTSDMIKEAHRKWMAGIPSENIIEMISERAFEDHPEIFGERNHAE